MKKWLSLALAFALCFTTAGCGQGAAGSSASQSPASEAVSQAEDPNRPDISGKVVYWSMWTEAEPQAESIKHAIEMFETDYPECEVEVNWMGRDIGKTLAPGVNGGEHIDVFDGIFYNADPTLFADISDVYETEAIGQPGVKFGDSILEGLLIADEVSSKEVGLEGRYGVPIGPWVVSFFYNKALFEQAGITDVPETWDEFLEVCEKLKDAGIPAMTTDDAYSNMTYQLYLSRLVGQDAIKKMNTDPADPVWTEGGIEATMTAMGELAANGYWSENAFVNKFPAGQQEFAMGQVAMYLNASWFPGEVSATAGPDFQWGQFSFPTVEGGVEEITTIPYSASTLCVSSKAENPEAAKVFIKYYASKEAQEMLVDYGFAPVTKGSPWPDTLADQAAILENAQEVLPFDGNWTSDFINGSVRPIMVSVVTGEKTAEEGIQEFQALFQ